MSRPQDTDRNQEATVYVGNLDERCTDALIWELMLQAGPIVNVHLPKDRISMAHQGYGFCEFLTEDDAEYACRIMNQIKLFGKPIRVNKASSDKKQIDIGANLFVGNLDPAVDERLLYETFGAFGPIAQPPKVARDPTSGVSKGYGFVSFDSFEAADAAIESMAGQFLANRPLNVSYALKKDGKGERHGTPAERLLAAQARKNNAMPTRAPPPPMMGMGYGRPPMGPPGMPMQPPNMPPGFQGQYAGALAGPPGMPGFGVPAYSGPPPPAPGQPAVPPGFGSPGPGPQGFAPPMQPQHFQGGPPPPPPGGPPGGFMTGSNSAPLGPRAGA